MIAFFRDVPVDACAADSGDMLLFQWGTYDWGHGEHFEIDMTRQFMGPSGEDDEISQLSLTFVFTPDAQLRSLGQGNRWCSSVDEVEAFRRFVASSAPYRAVSERTDGNLELDYEHV